MKSINCNKKKPERKFADKFGQVRIVVVSDERKYNMSENLSDLGIRRVFAGAGRTSLSLISFFFSLDAFFSLDSTVINMNRTLKE